MSVCRGGRRVIEKVSSWYKSNIHVANSSSSCRRGFGADGGTAAEAVIFLLNQCGSGQAMFPGNQPHAYFPLLLPFWKLLNILVVTVSSHGSVRINSLRFQLRTLPDVKHIEAPVLVHLGQD